jgi:hypothetical protein
MQTYEPDKEIKQQQPLPFHPVTYLLFALAKKGGDNTALQPLVKSVTENTTIYSPRTEQI